MSNHKLRVDTIAAHALRATDAATGAVVPALHMSTTFARDENYVPLLKENYQRSGSPNLWQAEETLAALEKGAECLLFPSGMQAIATLFETIPLGAHVVSLDTMYYGTRDWLRQLEAKGRISLTLFSATDPLGLVRALQKGKTDLVWIETPLNPTWDVVDIEAAASAAHAAGAILAVDATALATVTCNPLELGADIVFHSVTKYLNGHSDVLGGALITSDNNDRWKSIRTLRNKVGAALAPFECWLLMRGMRTLFVRYRAASDNAMAIAQHFAKHPNVEAVLYPGLESHAGHATAKKQMLRGFGGMMSVLLKADFVGAQKFCTKLKVVTPATSLGGCESLAEHRKTVEGPTSPVPDNLVRFSIGIENVDDLIADIEQALATL